MKPLEVYSHTFHLPADRRTVFALFGDPRALDRLTPPWFRLHPLGTVAQQRAAGTEIAYRLTWRGLPFRWTSRIVEWCEPERIVYEQLRGPYRSFRHEHLFTRVEAGTEVLDRVVYRAPGGAVVDRCLVRPDLRRIFAFRQRKALELLQGSAAAETSWRGARRIPWTSAASSAIDRPR